MTAAEFFSIGKGHVAITKNSTGGRRSTGRRMVVASVVGLVAGLTVGSMSAPQASAVGTPAASQPTAFRPMLNPAGVSITWRKTISGLSRPTQIVTAPDGSGRRFVVQSNGRVVLEDQGAFPTTPYLDTSTMVNPSGSKLLLSMAFARDFATTGRVYTVNQAADGTLVLSRWTAPTPASNSIPASARLTLLTIPYPSNAVHVGSQLAFDKVGYLYMSTGDAVEQDALHLAQNLGDLRGKVLRMQVAGCPGGAQLCVPPSNPYVGVAGARALIWAYGLRNPFRMSYDIPSSSLWIADVGQDRIEEIDRLLPNQAGANLGWSCEEGNLVYHAGTCLGRAPTAPLITYCHPDSVSGCTVGGDVVTGGLVYRGKVWNSLLNGLYIYSDFMSGNVWVANHYGRSALQTQPLFGVTSFAVDAQGNLLASTYDGNVWKATVTAG